MAALKKAAGAGLAIMLSASMVTLPAAQAHQFKTPIHAPQVPIAYPCPEPVPPVEDPCPEPEKPAPAPEPQKPEPQKPAPAPEPEAPVEDPCPEPEKPAPAPEPQKPEPQKPVPAPHPFPEPQKPVPAPHPFPEPQKPVPHPGGPGKVPTPPVFHPIPAPKHPWSKRHKEFTETQQVNGGIFKYGLRGGVWFSEYYHPTKCHTSTVQIGGQTITRQAAAGQWVSAQAPESMGLPCFTVATDC